MQKFIAGIVLGATLSAAGIFTYTRVAQHVAKDKLAAVCEASEYGKPCEALMGDYAMKFDGESR